MSNNASNARVTVDIREQVAHVRLSRADKYNGLDWDMLCALVDAARRLRRDRGVRAVILSGDGPAFCSGLDFASFARQPWRVLRGFLKYGIKATNLFQEACWCWRRLPLPVIAVLHGRCYGGGLQLALAADFRIATATCELSIMEARWGLVPDMTGTVTLRELLPIDVAKRLAMTGDIIDGRRALALGLVTELADDPYAAAEALAAQLRQRSPDALAVCKALLQRAWLQSPRQAFASESRAQRRLLMNGNHARARQANFAKQSPDFAPRRLDD